MISKDVKNILLKRSDELKINPSNIFIQNIPQDYTEVDETTVLISEINSIYSGRASDVSTTKESRIEIQIFYRGDTSPDITESIINQELEKNWFYQYDSYPDVDPDTGFLTRTMKYEKTEVI